MLVQPESSTTAERRPSPGPLVGSVVPYRIYVGVCVVLGTLAVVSSNTVGVAAAGVLGLSAPVAMVVAPRLHRPRVPGAWLWMAAATSAAVIASILRAGGGEEAGGALGHALALGSYILLGAALITMMKARSGGPGFPGAVLDGVLFTVSIVVLAWTVLVVPAVDGGPAGSGPLTALYPVLSGITVFLVTQLALTKVTRVLAFRLVGVALFAVLLADIGFAANSAGYADIPPVLFDLLYLTGSVLGALAALHPSMVQLTEPSPLAVERFSRWRIALLGAALAVPSLVVLFHVPAQRLERIPLATGGLIIVALVTARVAEAVTHYARSQETLAHAATHDALTELPNRTHLLNTLDRVLSGERPHGGVALLFCDLDRFKYVNDTWGHTIGDHLLGLVAARISAAAPPGATVARIGGDEFVVLRAGVPDPEAARQLAHRVRDAFETPFDLTVGSYHIAPSIGVAYCWPGAHADGADLIRHADTAMYVAKQSDEHVSLFDASMQEQVARRLELENELRGAADRGELVVHYQPVVDVNTGEIFSFEALVRWEHPARGLVPPLEFIPVSEETGTIIEIGDFVMSEAIATLGRWWAADPHRCPQIAVNVSGRQLRDTDFADHVESLLDLHGVPAHLLCVEITETAILDGSASTIGQLGRLSAIGVTIAADDFGTGYSSLSYLKRYPVNRVKIDREFVRGLDAPGGPRPDDVAIVDAVLAMATSLRLGVVAEGVETETQRAHLATRGCRWAQGWLFGKPVPTAEAERLLGRALPVAQ